MNKKNSKSFNVKLTFEDKREFFFSLQALCSSTENALLELALNENALVDKQKLWEVFYNLRLINLLMVNHQR